MTIASRIPILCSALVACLLAWSPVARASNYGVDEIPDVIPTEEAGRLKAAGIATTFALLEKGGQPKARKALAKQLKLSSKTLQEWVQLADVMRLKGVGPDVARLLSAAGVHTIAKLKGSDAEKLDEQIAKINEERKLSQNPPSREHLEAWIAQAKTLPIVLH